MPISLFSGLPGHGKTLRCLFVVEELRKRSGREVYYHRINELKLDWKPLADPRRWMDVPDGSIVVIDEAHEIFPKRGPSAVVPQHVNDLATHRHRGIDIFLITQHAKNQLDHFARGLIDGHEHTIRLMGLERSRIHKWNALGDPDDYHSRQASVTEQWNFPKEIYGWYKSAEVHTVQRKIAWKPILTIVGGIAAIAILGWLAMGQLWGAVADDEKLDPTDSAAEESSAVLQRAAASSVTLESMAPGIEGVPFSAPFYAPAIKVTAAPRVAGCGVIRVGPSTRCFCSDQQGNRLSLDKRTCLNYFSHGQFQFDKDEDYYPKVDPYVPPLAPPSSMPNQSESPEGAGAGSGDDQLT